MDGRPRPTFGCPSVLRLLDVYGESETPSTSGEGERKFTESLKKPESTVSVRVAISFVGCGRDIREEGWLFRISDSNHC